ncbi:superoxide dismutase, Cu-Zn family [Mytilus galloprovincialis]|uniref:Superoxide dismutase, Cu-Zn family n=1 Tax=Mytilus galloprovincialis TaxID=29158 RepID=A0A8B6BY85_MYTGA|nr:superoxide dismutase, Cu-Zn family [Mytilus galloprovincialis]
MVKNMQTLCFIILAALACDVSSTTMGEDNYSPKFSDGLPESVEISGHLGKHVKLRCKIDSNPGSFIIWYKEEDEIKSSKRIRIYKNYLLIKNFRAEDAKEYFCKGTNPFGSIVRRFFVSMSETEQEHDTTEELSLMKNQLSTLTRKFEDLSNNNVHIHINKDNDDQSTTMKGQHIFLNLMLNEKQSHQDKAIIDEEIHANCEMVTNSNFEEFGQIKGNVYLVQKEGGPVHVDVHLSGFEMREGKSHKHGFSLHEYGDMSRSCDSLGMVYNQKKPRHRSSRNSIMCDDEGEVHLKYMDKSLSLHGKHSVIGRSFVVYDDIEGRRIACCVIGRAEIHDHDEMDMEKIHFSEEFIEHHDTPTGEPIPFRPDPMFPGRYTTDKPIPFRPDPIFPGRQTTDRPIPYRPNPRFPDRDITEEPIPFSPDPRYPNRDIAHFIDE